MSFARDVLNLPLDVCIALEATVASPRLSCTRAIATFLILSHA